MFFLDFGARGPSDLKFRLRDRLNLRFHFNILVCGQSREETGSLKMAENKIKCHGQVQSERSRPLTMRCCTVQLFCELMAAAPPFNHFHILQLMHCATICLLKYTIYISGSKRADMPKEALHDELMNQQVISSSHVNVPRRTCLCLVT